MVIKNWRTKMNKTKSIFCRTAVLDGCSFIFWLTNPRCVLQLRTVESSIYYIKTFWTTTIYFHENNTTIYPKIYSYVYTMDVVFMNSLIVAQFSAVDLIKLINNEIVEVENGMKIQKLPLRAFVFHGGLENLLRVLRARDVFCVCIWYVAG